ncbi:MAG: hypothetical protein MJ209_06905 [archaeon]|nr:hypothetical protein [archaeon]
MSESALKVINAEINGRIVSTIDVTTLSSVGTLQGGLSSGSAKLSSGASQVSSGAEQVQMEQTK